MNKVYILGAGFSRKAGLPLMNEFYFRSKDIFPRLKNDKEIIAFKKVFEYFDKFSIVKNIMNADFLNIEELLSIIEMDIYLNGGENIYDDFLLYLAKVIEYSTPLNENRKTTGMIIKLGNSSYEDFIMKVYGIYLTGAAGDPILDIKKPVEGAIISLNYDLLLEFELTKINKHNQGILDESYMSYDFEYGINEEFIQRIHTKNPRHGFLPLAKIHGSVNFIKDNKPIIVPPTWNKTSNPEMKSVWQFAYKILSKAEEIIFIGCSLPESDSTLNIH